MQPRRERSKDVEATKRSKSPGNGEKRSLRPSLSTPINEIDHSSTINPHSLPGRQTLPADIKVAVIGNKLVGRIEQTSWLPDLRSLVGWHFGRQACVSGPPVCEDTTPDCDLRSGLHQLLVAIHLLCL